MVHNYYQIGGGEHTVFKNEIELLRENGHEVVEYTRSNDELKTSKLKLLFIPFTTMWSFKTYREVRAIIKREGIEIVHCHNTFPLISPSVYYAARSLKIPIVQTIHNFRLLCPNGSFFYDGKICEQCNEESSFKYAIKNKCYRNSKIQTLVLVSMLKVHKWFKTYNKINYIFLTDFNRRKFAKLIDIDSDNVFIKPNFVNQVVTESDYEPVTKKFVFASRLEENKGLKFLIQQWKRLPKDYMLHVYGDGPLKDYLVEEVNGIENIIYLGFKKQKEIFADLKDSVAMVFPSMWYEGFPMIIAESMSIGCPVISSDIGNQGDIVKNAGGGALFSLENEESFRKALVDVITFNAQYSENCKNYYKNVLSKDINYYKTTNIYEQCQKMVYRGGGNVF